MRPDRAHVTDDVRARIFGPTIPPELKERSVVGSVEACLANCGTVDPDLRRGLLSASAGIVRASNRWRDASRSLERLTPDAINMSGFLRTILGKDRVEKYVGRIETGDRLLVGVVTDIRERGAASIMDPYTGIYSAEFARELDEFMDAVRNSYGDFTEPPELLRQYEALADFFVSYIILGGMQGQDPESWDVRLQGQLEDIGIDDSHLVDRIINDIQQIRRQLPKQLNKDRIERTVYLAVEQIMAMKILRELEKCASLGRTERRPAIDAIALEMEAFIHQTRLNRGRVLINPHTGLMGPTGKVEGERVIDLYAQPLHGAHRLFDLLHKILQFRSSEAQQKALLMPTRRP